MKKLVLFGATIMVLVACAQISSIDEKEKAVGMANPASEFCVKQGGKLEIRKDAQGGEYGMCHLPNGQVVEEWDYFRKNSK